MGATPPEIEITTGDRKNAADRNRHAIAAKLSRMTPEKLADYIAGNFDALESALPRGMDLDAAVDALRGGKDDVKKKQKRAFVAAVRKLDYKGVEKLDPAKLGIKAFAASDFSFRREREKEKRKTKNGHLLAAVADVGKILTSSLGAIKVTGAGILNTGWALVKPFGYAAKAGAHLTRAYPKPAAMALFAAVAGGAALANVEVDSSPYISQMDGFKNAFHKACTPDLLKGSASNVAYTMLFNTGKKNGVEKHTHDTMMMAARHGVPAIALHLMSYLESAKFTDMKANNSSASNPFQIINTTKILYMKSYGKDTFMYKDAVQRQADGRATVFDNSLVAAVDVIRQTPIETLNRMIVDQKYPGPVHDALVHSDISAMAAELVALDLLKKHPEIADRKITVDQIVSIVTDHYRKNHFLGAGNYETLRTVAAKQPGISITDVKIVKASFGPETASRLRTIVTLNPGLLKEGMTAGQALNSIGENFKTFVRSQINEYTKVYHPRMTTYDLCLTDAAKKMDLPRTIPAWKAAVYDMGLMPYAKQIAGYTEPTTREILNSVSQKFNATPVIDAPVARPPVLQEQQGIPVANIPIPKARPKNLSPAT